MCSLFERHLGYFDILDIVNKAVTDINVHVFIWVCVFNSLGCITRSGNFGSDRNSVFFSGTPKLFSKAAALFYTSTSNVFLHFPTNSHHYVVKKKCSYPSE
jgi:hypothetical protein